jgi:CRISPR-associated protein Csm5
MSDQAPILIEKRLRIKTLSVVHIGTGEQLGPKDYARQKQQVFVAKPDKLLSTVRRSPELESAFLNFCEDGQQTLTEFLHQQRIRFEDVAAYSVRATGQIARLIPMFVRTLESKPYIPGSSLKGAVRSAIFRSRVMADKAVYNAAEKVIKKDLNELRRQRNPNLRRWRKTIGIHVERTFFGEDEHHDLMRCLQFGDCTPCDPTALSIAEVQVLSVGGNGSLRHARNPRRHDRHMRPVTPEVLRKGVELFCPLTINLHLMGAMSPVRGLGFGEKTQFIKGWMAECNETALALIEQEIDFFTRHPFAGKCRMAHWYEALKKQLLQVKKTDNQCLSHISWGSGWDAKTVTDQFSDSLFHDLRHTLKLNVGRAHVVQHGRLQWGNTLLDRNDSPKSRKIVFENGQPKEPLGWVKITVEEATG